MYTYTYLGNDDVVIRLIIFYIFDKKKERGRGGEGEK